ncbi:MAG: DUF5615 family PIN-like protein [Anaerolineae bacterium]|nr:DUF5615 family PIN-like protein [Anaerolineae bacterium]
MTDQPPKLKFYFDTHIPKAVAIQLRSRGIDVVRCEEVDLAEADDVEHLEYATAHGLTVVSHDLDFPNIHAEWVYQGLRHAGIVVFSRKMHGNIGKLVTELFDWYQLIEVGAGSVEEDVYNKLIEINR